MKKISFPNGRRLGQTKLEKLGKMMNRCPGVRHKEEKIRLGKLNRQSYHVRREMWGQKNVYIQKSREQSGLETHTEDVLGGGAARGGANECYFDGREDAHGSEKEKGLLMKEDSWKSQ